jgi:hypothetical protein
VAGSESEEEAKASKLAELRAAGDLREVVFDVTMVVTGVSKYGEATGEPWKPMSPPYLPRSFTCAGSERGRSGSRSATARDRKLRAGSIRACRDVDDAGEIAEGWFSVDGGVLTVTDTNGKYVVGSRAMIAGEDPKALARLLLREARAPEDFNRRLDYPKPGIA